MSSTIRQTVESLLSQTYQNFIIHIVDNASTDETVAIVEKIGDPRLIVHRHDANIGAEGNFTRCMKLAGGSYTCIFHADDVYSNEMVETQVLWLNANKHIEAVFSQVETINDGSMVTGHIDMIPAINAGEVREYSFLELFKGLLRYRNRLVISSLMVRTFVFTDYILTWGDGRFKSASDVDMYLRLARRCAIGVIGRRLMQYRIGQNQFSHKIRNRLTRPDFFLVMDAYLHENNALLTQSDFDHYRWLDRHDRVARALNAASQGNTDLVKQLLENCLSVDALRAAFSGRTGSVTLLAAIILKSMSNLGLLKYSGELIRWAKAKKWN
ncbi:glycosyltransferase [Xylophilus rhododendri]|uniref:Glycosyltransferase n=1 Tax=Xylophilus rhododendri TaxID=2697032 RepID=A0A857J7Y7_9BURK|nr:glycosyltransferase family 2 protein [Xylophilus rhododendri]QHJ00161.1 glycosyltransferase [Xylophilus rhododendri]